jgi:two-component system phosphate regulon sensor histidine kinase PhoR
MRRRRLLWQLYPAYILLTVLALLGVTWYATATVRQFHYREVRADLEAKARLAEKQIGSGTWPLDHARLQSLAHELASRAFARVTIILPDGQVLADSHEADPASMVNHSDRPEIIEALAGRCGVTTRWSATLNQEMMYVAVPLMRDGRIAGIVRTAVPLTSVNLALQKISRRLYATAAVVAGIVALLSLVVYRRINRSLQELTRAAESLARGELDHRLPATETIEFRQIARAMNLMAGELNRQLRTVLRQRNQLEVLLSSMQDGVLAVDSQESLIILNDSAARLIGAEPAKAIGRSIQEVVRNSDLQRFVTQVLTGRGPARSEIVLEHEGEQFLDVHGTVLRDAQGQDIGAVVVLHDVTRLKRLENVRKDFVANVSHELRTPVTLIKGFMETLLDGQPHSPEDTQRFLTIVARQADRLNAIIEDLLSLSRIEQEHEKALINLEQASIREMLESAVQTCEPKARERGIVLEVACDPDLRAAINAPLLEQAVVNLVDNAIKYSEPGQPVHVCARAEGSDLVITVRDCGCGIPREHLPRIFERFYRVDKSRSRAQGSTGLGLSIVKHIAQAHAGRVDVESTPGQGSTFYVRLPLNRPEEAVPPT